MGAGCSASRRLHFRDMDLHPGHPGNLADPAAQDIPEVGVFAADTCATDKGPDPALDILAVGQKEQPRPPS